MDHNETSLLEKDLAEEEQARRDLVTQVEDWRNDIKRLIIEKDARVAMMQLEVKKSMMDDAVKVTEATIMIERKIRIATVHQEIKATSIAVYKRKMDILRVYKEGCNDMGIYAEWHHLLPLCMRGSVLDFRNYVRIQPGLHLLVHAALCHFFPSYNHEAHE